VTNIYEFPTQGRVVKHRINPSGDLTQYRVRIVGSRISNGQYRDIYIDSGECRIIFEIYEY
jgi:hypothetical protein